jgi:DNA-binding CsgD family transcriptional regulator
MNGIKEGEILNKYMSRRFRNNKNLLQAITGATGSGKTYLGLRECELWYDFWFHEPYPIKNVCFSVGELMRRLSSKELREGDLLMLEEAGVNLGSSDWQFKIVKMFNYILQSFRSMNVGIVMTLPVLSMLAKQARQLLHNHIITQSIDFSTNMSKSKCLFHQLNQLSGKSYWKYMRILYKGKMVAIERINYGLPSETLRIEYENKKTKFVTELTDEFSRELDKIELDKIKKDARDNLTKTERRRWDYKYEERLNNKEIAKKEGCSLRSVYKTFENIERKGYVLPKVDFSLEK